MMTNFRNIPGNLMKAFRKMSFAGQNASDHMNEWKQMSAELHSIECQMDEIVEKGAGLTGPDALINREQYRALEERRSSLTAQFGSMGRLASALNSESMLEKERETVRRMTQQAQKLGDPEDFEAALDELIIRRNILDKRVSAVNEARARYESANTTMSIPEDDKYAQRIAKARARKEAQAAAALTEIALDAREKANETEGEILE